MDDATTEFEPLADTRRATDLRLVGSWDTSASYGVTVNGVTAAFALTPAALSVNGVSSSPSSTVVVSFPAAQANMLPNPGFEEGAGRWTTTVTGGTQASFELNTQKPSSHTGSNSVRIADPAPSSSPYVAGWTSEGAGVIPGKSYSASAFVKARALRAVNRVYENGKYSTAQQYNSYARVSLRWLDRDGAVISEKDSPELTNSNDWTPLDVTDTAPAQAQYASVVLKTAGPDAQGTLGSAWFDDVALRRSNVVSGQVPALGSVAPQSGANSGSMSVQLSGAGFQSGATVRLRKAGQADIAGSSVQVTVPGTITCAFDLTGATTGAWDVEVTNANGERSTIQAGFSVLLPGPALSVSSCAPSSGAINTVVSITALAGAGFQQGATVRLEKSGVPAINASQVTVASSTKITASVDLNGAQTGTYDVVVRNPDAQEARLTGGFTFNLASTGCASGGASGVLLMGLAMGLMAAARWHDRGRSPLRNVLERT